MARKKSGTTTSALPYTGLLAEPLPIIPSGLDASNPPPSFEGSAEEWRQRVCGLKENSFKRFLACLELACIHHAVDIRSENLGWDLAFALLEAHVPAFNTEASIKKYNAKRKTDAGRPTTLDLVGTVHLLNASEKLHTEARKAGRKVSERRLARELSKLPQFKARSLEEETIRKLLGQMRRAWSDYKSGRATEFQMQFIEEVVPFVLNEGKVPKPDDHSDMC